MISSEVQRTLVKSPPELWAELSDPAALARHLGEFGEIRIIRTEPEKTVEWTAENTTGTVSIQPSGWGTNVKLTVTREIEEPTLAPEAPAASPETSPMPDERSALELEPASEPDPKATLAAEPALAPEPEIEPEPHRGFFARLFGRRRRAEPLESSEPEAPDAFAAVREALAPETFASEHPFAALPEIAPVPITPAPQTPVDTQETSAEHLGDLSAELMAAEEVAAEEVTAVLTAVLDRLGAAHHRPFSRA